MKFTLIAEQLFDGEAFHRDVPVTIEDGLIASLDTASGAKEIRYPYRRCSSSHNSRVADWHYR